MKTSGTISRNQTRLHDLAAMPTAGAKPPHAADSARAMLRTLLAPFGRPWPASSASEEISALGRALASVYSASQQHVLTTQEAAVVVDVLVRRYVARTMENAIASVFTTPEERTDWFGWSTGKRDE